MVDALIEGLLSEGLDSLDRRLHARRLARYAEKHGLRYDRAAKAPHMAQAFGELGSGELKNLLSGRLDGTETLAWERTAHAPLGADFPEYYQRHPSGHFVVVPLPRNLPATAVLAWHPLLTADDCPWLPGAARMHLRTPHAERLFRVAAVDHDFARALIDEPELLRRPRRSWAILGPWAVLISREPLRLRGPKSLRSELEYVRTLTRRLR